MSDNQTCLCIRTIREITQKSHPLLRQVVELETTKALCFLREACDIFCPKETQVSCY